MKCLFQTLPKQCGAYAKVYWNALWKEYRVRFYHPKQYGNNPIAAYDYFTVDAQDAYATAIKELDASFI